MKRYVALIAVLLASMFGALVPLSIEAVGPPEGLPRGRSETLPPGWIRTNSHTVTHLIGTEIIGGKKYGTYEATVTSLPVTLDDNRTLIDTNWYLQTDVSGQTWFQTGANTFTARVSGGRVSVEDRDGRLSVWNSSICIGGECFTGSAAVIADDPLNENYQGNCLKWEYGSYSTGWWIFGDSAPVVRYLRTIEGYISEMWILPMDPKASVVINLNTEVEAGYDAEVTWLQAFDADGTLLRVSRNKFGVYTIRADEFKDKKFPITIDPTLIFSASFSDAFNYYQGSFGASYASVWGQPTGGLSSPLNGAIYPSWAGQWFIRSASSDNYRVERAYVHFNTSGIPDDAIISQSDLWLYTYMALDEGSNSALQIQTGMPTYPRDPVLTGDFNQSYYQGAGLAAGYYYYAMNESGYKTFNLSSQGISWINKVGYTKFAVRSTDDINAIPPAYASGYFTYYTYGFWQAEKGSGYIPKLGVVYTIPVVVPTATTNLPSSKTETSVVFHGTLTSDGNEPSSVRFQYDTTTAYSYATAWTSGYTTGQAFYKNVYGLTPGEYYYYRAQASNSAGTGTGSGVAFITYPYRPSVFTATGEEDQTALTWTKGTGAQKTMIRRSATSYPTTPSSGTQIYFDTGTTHDDTSVVNGVIYYYSAWSYATEGGLAEYSQFYQTDYAASYALGAPTITTNAATSVTQTTATLNLYLNNLGGYSTTDVWFQYYKGAGTWTDNETTSTEKSAPGSHSAGIASLTADTLYHMRAVAQNTAGTVYGSDVPFTTGAVYAPSMTTQAATGTQLDSATLNGAVADDGGTTCTVWFEWGLTTSYGSSTPTISGLSTDDTFYYGLADLEPNTTYHYRALGQNSAGIGYGADVDFITTTPSAPTVRTDAATSIGSNQAVLNATVLTDGGVECEVRFQWGNTTGYGTDTAWVSGYTKDQTFDELIAGLTIGETYHFRAQTKNDGGTGSGSDATFTTVFTAPTSFRAKAISSTTINFEWIKTGDQTYIKYKQSGFPIDRADGDFVYLGTGTTASISGLTAGTTYYFRAWSWREGDVWAVGYADDVATTQATLPAGEEEEPEMVKDVVEPASWFQAPSGGAITGMPFYEVFAELAVTLEMEEGSLWLVISLLLVIVVAVAAYLYVQNAFIAIAAGCLTVIGCSTLGMMPLWFIVVYLAVGGGTIYVTSRV